MSRTKNASKTLARLFPVAFAAAGSLALLGSASEARAETTIGVDFNQTDSALREEVGSGVEATIGWRYAKGWRAQALELTGGYQDFGPDRGSEVAKLLLGFRIGYDGLVRPSFFSRAGVGYMTVDTPVASPIAGGNVSALTSAPIITPEGSVHFAGQTGVAFDVQVLPKLDIGVQASYNWVKLTDSFEWWQGGVHATFVFNR
jgi:hypothetical protein